MPENRADQPAASPAFRTGQRVRVKQGVKDVDYPDLPLGGWSGTVAEIGQGDPPTYLVEWDRRTLEAAHPVYRKRCQRDGYEMEKCWLAETELEPDSDEPAEFEQPTDVTPAPLDMDSQEDRIRAVLGLTGDDPLPSVTTDTLKKYHRFLAARLQFPFEATARLEKGPELRVTITGLLNPDEYECDESYGLICSAKRENQRMEIPLWELAADENTDPGLLISDYGTWFWNWR